MVLGLLAAAQIVDGYLGTVLTQTISFATDEFGHGNSAQGWVLGVARVGVLFSLVTVGAGRSPGPKIDARRGGARELRLHPARRTRARHLDARRLAARSPGVSRPGSGILIAIVAAEEMPARSRAWAASVLVLSAGLGSGIAVNVLRLADLGTRGWRGVYLVGGLGVIVIVWVGRRLPETLRFAHDRAMRRRPCRPTRSASVAANA